MKIDRLALTTDLSPCARQAYAPAADLARRFGARLDLVHCLDYPAQYLHDEFLPVEGSLEAFRRMKQLALEQDASSQVFEGISVEPHLLDGQGPEAIRAFTVERGTDFLIQTSHGYTGWKRFWIGSFGERVLRTSVVPVLTFKIHEGSSDEAERLFRPKRILFPHDFSAASLGTLDVVRLLARTYGTRVLVFHAWQSPADLVGLGDAAEHVPELAVLSLASGDTERLLGELREIAGRELEGIEHNCQVMGGDPASLIISRAATFEADLICMATHGLTGFKRFMLGSVAEKVLRGAPCPTLVVRPRDDKGAGRTGS